MGCVVNGPRGRAATRTSASRCPEPARTRARPVYVDGALELTLKGDSIVADFLRLLDDYVETRYGAGQESRARA